MLPFCPNVLAGVASARLRSSTPIQSIFRNQFLIKLWIALNRLSSSLRYELNPFIPPISWRSIDHELHALMAPSISSGFTTDFKCSRNYPPYQVSRKWLLLRGVTLWTLWSSRNDFVFNRRKWSSERTEQFKRTGLIRIAREKPWTGLKRILR